MRPLVSGVAAAAALSSALALARPSGPLVLCQTYPEAPACRAGLVDCGTCHAAPPALNAFGDDLQAALGAPTTGDDDYAARLPGALALVEAEDSDGDGTTNLAELLGGTLPGDPASSPGGDCGEASRVGPYRLCAYDPAFALRRVSLDVCGHAPSREDLRAARDAEDGRALVVERLRACLRTDFWIGVDGQLWQLAFPKVRPRVPFARAEGAFEPDLNLFVWTQTGDRDARELLTARYQVERDDGTRPPTYTAVTPTGPRAPDPSRMAGMLTTTWFNASNTMGQAIPRVTAAQAYRAYLGYDLARPEGLFDPVDPTGVPLPLIDYDEKGIDDPACAGCHRTLDPLAYLFSRYAGAGESRLFRDARPRPPPPGQYAPNRMVYMADYDGGPGILAVPETGALFGQPGYTLVEWAAAAASSEAFARNLVGDYWERLVGRRPGPDDAETFEAIWRGFMTSDGYRVERMLERLVQTEAYGVP